MGYKATPITAPEPGPDRYRGRGRGRHPWRGRRGGHIDLRNVINRRALSVPPGHALDTDGLAAGRPPEEDRDDPPAAVRGPGVPRPAQPALPQGPQQAQSRVPPALPQGPQQAQSRVPPAPARAAQPGGEAQQPDVLDGAGGAPAPQPRPAPQPAQPGSAPRTLFDARERAQVISWIQLMAQWSKATDQRLERIEANQRREYSERRTSEILRRAAAAAAAPPLPPRPGPPPRAAGLRPRHRQLHHHQEVEAQPRQYLDIDLASPAQSVIIEEVIQRGGQTDTDELPTEVMPDPEPDDIEWLQVDAASPGTLASTSRGRPPSSCSTSSHSSLYQYIMSRRVVTTSPGPPVDPQQEDQPEPGEEEEEGAQGGPAAPQPQRDAGLQTPPPCLGEEDPPRPPPAQPPSSPAPPAHSHLPVLAGQDVFEELQLSLLSAEEMDPLNW